MTRTPLLMLVAGAFAGAALVASTALAQEKATETKLPDAVEKTFRTAFPKGEIHKVDAEEENGVTVYDFEFKDGDSEKETDIAADGTMLEFTIVVVPDSIPAAAMKTISNAAKGAKIERLEHIEVSYETKDGKVVKLPKVLTRYAAEMSKRQKRAEVVVNPDGTVIDSPEWIAVEAKPEAKPDTKAGK